MNNRSFPRFLNPRAYGARALALANELLLTNAEALLAPSDNFPLRYPPVFFLGAPRSGSTLMIQVITHALDLGYISNRHCQWYGAPALVERFLPPTARNPAPDYRSAYGITRGSHAPAECGQWWYRFFRRKPPYVTLEDTEPQMMQRFRQSIAALTNAFDRPVLFKNLYASLRIQAIGNYLPESLFVVIHRDEIDNGHSLLEARERSFRDYQRWWSMEPPEVDFLRTLPPHQQVIEQIRHIHATIERDLKIIQLPRSRRLDICYEEFCADPGVQIDALQAFLASNDCKIQRAGAIPPSFKRRNEMRIDPSVYAAMAAYAKRV